MKSYPCDYEGAPDYDEDPDWIIDLATELAEEIPAPNWCTDLDADRKLRAHFNGKWELYDDETVSRLTDRTNWILDNDYNRGEPEERAA